MNVNGGRTGGQSHGTGGYSHGLGGYAHRPGGSGAYGGACHTHGGVPCCGQHSGDRSVDVSVHVHIGRNQLKGGHTGHNNQGVVLSVSNLTQTSTGK